MFKFQRDKIVEFLSKMLVQQDRFESGLEHVATGLEKLANSQEKLINIQERQEKTLIKILGVLADDIPRFDELIEMEQIDGKKALLRKTK